MSHIENDACIEHIGQPTRGQRQVVPDWESLVDLEPRLAGLLAEAQSIVQSPETNGHAAATWFGWNRPGLKARLVSLIGWGRPITEVSEDEVLLHSPSAYTVAYEKLYKACGC